MRLATKLLHFQFLDQISMNTKILSSAVSEAAQEGSKEHFLTLIRDVLAAQGSVHDRPENIDRIVKLLSCDIGSYPLCYTRLDLSDADRLARLISESKAGTAISLLEGIIWDAITVSADDCDVCLGEERIYMYDPEGGHIIKQCQLCSSTIDLQGRKATSSASVRPPFEEELRAAGVELAEY